MPITMPGMGTGLNLQNMAQTMAQNNLAPRGNQLTTRETKVNKEIAALEELEQGLNDFYQELSKLSKPETFGNLKVNMDEDASDFISLKADDNAVANSYQIAVTSLASKDKWSMISAPSSKEEAFSEAGNVTIELKDGTIFNVAVDAGDSLTDVMNTINESEHNPGVGASIISGSGEARLTLTSNKTGTQSAIASITMAKADGTTSNMGSNIHPATDAEFSIDGIPVTSQSNEIEDVITGLTLTLKKTTEAGKPIDVDLSDDTDTMKESINTLVDSYNDLLNTVEGLTKSSPAQQGEAAVRPALAGDSMTSMLSTQLRSAISSTIPASDLARLSNIGIISSQSGGLEIDSTKLRDALKENPDEVVDLFIGEDAVIEKLNDVVEIYIGSPEIKDDEDEDSDVKTNSADIDGLIGERLDSLKDDKRDIDDNWDEVNRRAQNLYQRYFNELVAMDQAVTQMKSSMNMLVSSLPS